MQSNPADPHTGPNKPTVLTKQPTANHVAQFTPARDSRNRRVPGLYIRNGRYYCQLWMTAAMDENQLAVFRFLIQRICQPAI